jgi:hypothetical protein
VTCPFQQPETRRPAPGVWYISRHAIERWCARVRPELDPVVHYPEILRELVAIAEGAVETSGVTRDGKVIWLHHAWPAVQFVVGGAPEPHLRPALVTVLDAPTWRGQRGAERRARMAIDARHRRSDDDA